MNPPHDGLVGYSPVYAPATPQPAPAPAQPEPTRWGSPVERLVVVMIWLAVGATASFWVVDTQYGGANIRAIQAERDQALAEAAQAQAQTQELLNRVRLAAGCE